MNKYTFVSFLFLAGFFGVNSVNAETVIYTTSIDTAPQTIDAGTFSAPINIHIDPVATTGGLDFVLSTTNSDSSSYYFTNANATSCTTTLAYNTIHLNAGNANKRFCYFDSTPGIYTLSAENPTSTTASQDITIVGSLPSDTTPPVVALNAPVQDSVIETGDVPYSFVFTDNIDEAIDCELYLDGQFAGNASASNGVEYSSTLEGIADGLHSLFVSCADVAGNIGTSNENSFTVDTSTPEPVEPAKPVRKISGGRVAVVPKVEVLREISGCGEETSGYSSITGEFCAYNILHQEEGEVLGAEKFVFTMFLKREQPPYSKGVYADEVLELQKLLNANGYKSGPEDGKFGPITEGAVIRFQLANGLVGDGIVGPMTRELLNK